VARLALKHECTRGKAQQHGAARREAARSKQRRGQASRVGAAREKKRESLPRGARPN
jgi:hypothetical protein